MIDFLLLSLQVWSLRALLVGLGIFALIQYLRHRSGSNLAFASGGLLISSGVLLEIVTQSFFSKTVETEAGVSIGFPSVPYNVGMVLVIVGCGICIITGALRVVKKGT